MRHGTEKPRRRCKIKSVDEIKSLDSSSLRRLCSSSVPERREEVLRDVLRRVAQWDLPCQEYARRLRRWQPEVMLRCLEAAPETFVYGPVCREFCPPAGIIDGAAHEVRQAEVGARPEDLDNLLQEGLAEFYTQDFDNVTARAASCVTPPLISIARSLQLPSSMGCSSSPLPDAVPVQDVSVKRRVHGGEKWRQPSSVSTNL